MKSLNSLRLETSDLLEEKYSQDDILRKFKEVHGDKYDYSKVQYNHNREPVVIHCPVHDLDFEQKPVHHIHYACGCPECARESTRNATVSNNEDFIVAANRVHGKGSYKYDDVNYLNARTPVNITCCECGSEFMQTPNKHLSGNGCPVCSESNGERTIRGFLSGRSMEFKSQHTFDDCKANRPLPFDFFIPSLNTAIEYDGKQHFKPLGFMPEEVANDQLAYQQKCDGIKNDYCKNKNIKLVRIPYTAKDIVAELMKALELEDEETFTL